MAMDDGWPPFEIRMLLDLFVEPTSPSVLRIYFLPFDPLL